MAPAPEIAPGPCADIFSDDQLTTYEIQMAADISEPDKKCILYSGGKVQVYQPKIDQVTEYNPGKSRSDLESFLVLGFGGTTRSQVRDGVRRLREVIG